MFSPEFKEEAVKAVIETSRPIAQVAKELGIVEGTLGGWVSVYRREHAANTLIYHHHTNAPVIETYYPQPGPYARHRIRLAAEQATPDPNRL
jgi:transposase-like protein